MIDKLRVAFAIVAVVMTLSGCVAYQPVPVAVVQPSMQERIDRSWDAAAGAMADQGMTITAQDRRAGMIRGDRGGTTITAQIETLPDGRVQVKFDSSGAPDAGLVDGVTDSYNRRMGR
jgi:hypothetical protein